ncbi:magnesium transporter [Spiroplasma endosymbiont of Aspidapion aeneum]|uniref:magnesium transporter n=1 Tax=Spiroplasma endosymbiont of Aspidapion aeneum TaxID=3066276 RepID=UPI00313BB2D6
MENKNEILQLSDSLKILVDNSDFDKIKQLAADFYAIDFSEALSSLDTKYIIVVLRILESNKSSIIFSEFNNEVQKNVAMTLNEKWMAKILDAMNSDDAADIMENLPPYIVKKILEKSSPETKYQFSKLLNYKDDTAGGIMSVDYIVLRDSLNVIDALELIKKNYKDIENTNTTAYFVVDKNNVLCGLVHLGEIFFASDIKKIRDIMNNNVIYVNINDDQEVVANKMKKYDIPSIPVVNNENKLMGIIMIDDVLDVMSEETTEDIYKLGGINYFGKDSYFSLSIFKIVKSRLLSIFMILFISTLSQILLTIFINKEFNSNSKNLDYVITLFITPLIVVISCSSGAIASQTTLLTVRSISLDQLKSNKFFDIVRKEIIIGLLFGIIVALLNFVRLIVFYEIYYSGDINKNYIWLSISSISISIILTVFISNFIGCIIPLTAKYLKRDAAVSSIFLLETIVDLISILILYGISYIFIYNIGNGL